MLRLRVGCCLLSIPCRRRDRRDGQSRYSRRIAAGYDAMDGDACEEVGAGAGLRGDVLL
jgi:hypothetical protein